MAFKFQYNKTEMQRIRKQLGIRERALPTLKSKESALRLEVKKAQNKMKEITTKYNEVVKKISNINKLWNEFPDIIDIENIEIKYRKIAGIKVPELNKINFIIKEFLLFNQKAWLSYGIDYLKDLIELDMKKDIYGKQVEVLALARIKTTQKVNLYEKVQIPQFKEALMKIKRFMEDAENLQKSSQKIVKERNRKKEAAL